jgi:hypothetical protein
VKKRQYFGVIEKNANILTQFGAISTVISSRQSIVRQIKGLNQIF